MNVWPTPTGDHRGARRGRAAGAKLGRIRWTWRAPAGVSQPLVGRDRIVVAVGSSIHVLDATGVERGRIDVPEDSWQLACLVGDLVIIRREGGLEARDLAGMVKWRYAPRDPIQRVHVGPRDDLVVWTSEARPALQRRSELVWLDAEGEERWAMPYAFVMPGLVLDQSMAFDDDGSLYTFWRSRMGDGVSGDDVAFGGIAAYDVQGCRFARRSPAPAWLSQVFGRAHGAICGGGPSAVVISPDGEYGWTSDPDAAVPTVLGNTGITLLVDPQLDQVPEVTQRNTPQHSTRLAASFDEPGNRYISTMLWGPPRSDRILSLDPEHGVRWVMDVEPVDWSIGPPVVGLDESTLFVLGSTLLAIE